MKRSSKISTGTFLTVLSLFTLAFVPRFLLLSEYKAGDPYFDAFLLDSEVYFKWAKEIIGGGWIGKKAFYHAPLYPYFVAIFLKIFRENFYLFFLFQITLNSLTTVLLYFAGTDFFNKKTGVIAALLFAFTDLFAFYSLKLLPATLSIFMLVLFVLLFRKAGKENSSTHWLLCGLLAGALSLLRSNLLLLYPLVLLHFFISAKYKAVGWGVKAAIFSVGFFVFISLSASHNYILERDVVLVSTNGGETFYHGNNINAVGTYAHPPEISPSLQFQNEDARKTAEEELGKKLKSSEISRFWFNKGMEFIFEDPLRYLVLELKKIRLLFSGMDASIIYYLDFERSEFIPKLKLFFINYAVIFPLGLVGMWLSMADWRKYFILLGIVGISILTLLFFFVTTRYRLPMVPFLILFGAYALSFLDLNFYRKGLFYCIAILLSISIITNRWETRRYKPNLSAIYCNLGYTLAEQKDFSRALKIFTKAQELNKNNITPYLGIISMYAMIGAKKRAIKFYKMVYPMMHPRMVRETLRDPALASIHQEISDFLEEQRKG